MSNTAIIFAGGSGARMGSGIPKQFIEVNGKPIIIHTLEIFDEHPDIDSIYIACREDYIPRLEKLIKRFLITKVKAVVPGGETGQDSIYNALKRAAEDEDAESTVLIHDGVRPCIGAETISRCLEAVEKYGNCVTCTPLFETPVLSHGGELVDDLPDRDDFFTAQAPQCFPLGKVIEAHEKIRKEETGYKGVIDTCTLMKRMGEKVKVLVGPRGNIKVTTPEDLFIFKALIEYKETEHVFGFGDQDVAPNLKK